MVKQGTPTLRSEVRGQLVKGSKTAALRKTLNGLPSTEDTVTFLRRFLATAQQLGLEYFGDGEFEKIVKKAAREIRSAPEKRIFKFLARDIRRRTDELFQDASEGRWRKAPYYSSFQEALRRFEQGTIRWERTTYQMRGGFLRRLAVAAGASVSELTLRHFRDQQIPLSGGNTKGLMGLVRFYLDRKTQGGSYIEAIHLLKQETGFSHDKDFLSYASFAESKKAFLEGRFSWRRADRSIRLQFLRELAGAFGKEPGALTAADLKDRSRSPFLTLAGQRKSLEGLLETYIRRGRKKAMGENIPEVSVIRLLKKDLGLKDLIPRRRRQKPWREIYDNPGIVDENVKERVIPVEGIDLATVDSLAQYRRDVEKYRKLSEHELIFLTQEIQKGNRAAWQALTEHGLRFAIKPVLDFHLGGRKSIPLDDLFSTAREIITKNIHRFRPRRGLLSSFIHQTVHWRLIDEYRKEASRRRHVREGFSMPAEDESLTEALDRLPPSSSGDREADGEFLSEEKTVDDTLQILETLKTKKVVTQRDAFVFRLLLSGERYKVIARKTGGKFGEIISSSRVSQIKGDVKRAIQKVIRQRTSEVSDPRSEVRRTGRSVVGKKKKAGKSGSFRSDVREKETSGRVFSGGQSTGQFRRAPRRLKQWFQSQRSQTPYSPPSGSVSSEPMVSGVINQPDINTNNPNNQIPARAGIGNSAKNSVLMAPGTKSVKILRKVFPNAFLRFGPNGLFMEIAFRLISDLVIVNPYFSSNFSRSEVRSASPGGLRRTEGPKAVAEPWRSRAEMRETEKAERSVSDEFGEILIEDFEADLAGVERMMKSGVRRLTDEEKLFLFKALHAKNLSWEKRRAPRNFLVEAYLPFVYYILRQLRPNDFEEAVQDGTVGLIKAVHRHNPWLGFSFLSYAKWWIHSEVESPRRKPFGVTGISRDRRRQLFRTIDALRQKLEREPQIDEIAEALRISPSEILSLLSLNRRPASLGREEDFETIATSEGLERLREAQPGGVNELAKDLGIPSSRVTLDLIHSIPEKRWLLLAHFYGIGVEKAERMAGLKTLMEAKGYRFASIQRLIDAKYEALRSLRASKTGRELLAERLGISPVVLTNEMIENLPTPYRIVLQSRYGIGRHRLLRARDIAFELANAGFASEGRPYGRNWIFELKKKGEGLLKLQLKVDFKIDYRRLVMRFRKRLRTKDGYSLLASDLGKEVSSITEECLRILTPRQRRLLDLYYGLTEHPSSSLAEVARTLWREGHNDPRSKGPANIQKIGVIKRRALSLLKKYRDGWHRLAKKLGIPASVVKRRFPSLPLLESAILKMSYGIDEQRKSGISEVARELKERKIFGRFGPVGSEAIRHAKVNGQKRLLGKLPEAKFSLRKAAKQANVSPRAEVPSARRPMTPRHSLRSEARAEVRQSGPKDGWENPEKWVDPEEILKDFVDDPFVKVTQPSNLPKVAVDRDWIRAILKKLVAPLKKSKESKPAAAVLLLAAPSEDGGYFEIRIGEPGDRPSSDLSTVVENEPHFLAKRNIRVRSEPARTIKSNKGIIEIESKFVLETTFFNSHGITIQVNHLPRYHSVSGREYPLVISIPTPETRRRWQQIVSRLILEIEGELPGLKEAVERFDPTSPTPEAIQAIKEPLQLIGKMARRIRNDDPREAFFRDPIYESLTKTLSQVEPLSIKVREGVPPWNNYEKVKGAFQKFVQQIEILKGLIEQEGLEALHYREHYDGNRFLAGASQNRSIKGTGIPDSSRSEVRDEETRPLTGEQPNYDKGRQKIRQIQTLLTKLDRELEERGSRIRVDLLGTVHDFHIDPERIPSFWNRDLVTLELQRRFERRQSRENPFWEDLIAFYEANRPAWGLHGVNVSGDMRIARRKMIYELGMRGGGREETAVINLGSKESFSSKELGGRGSKRISVEEILGALSPDHSNEFREKGITMVQAGAHPFGKKRLVILKPADPSLHDLIKRVRPLFEVEFEKHRFTEKMRNIFIYFRLVEPMLAVYNDRDLVHEMLIQINRQISLSPEKGGAHSVLHIGGMAHNYLLEKLLTLAPSERIKVHPDWEGRFLMDPFTEAWSPVLFEDLTGILSNISVEDGEVKLNPDFFEAYLSRAVKREPEYFKRLLLLTSLTTGRETNLRSGIPPPTVLGSLNLLGLRNRYWVAKLSLPQLETLEGRVSAQNQLGNLLFLPLMMEKLEKGAANLSQLIFGDSLNRLVEKDPFFKAHQESFLSLDSGGWPVPWISPEETHAGSSPGPHLFSMEYDAKDGNRRLYVGNGRWISPLRKPRKSSQPYRLSSRILLEVLQTPGVLDRDKKLLDLRSGDGVILAGTADLVKEAVGIEGNRRANTVARRNIRELGLKNVEIRQGDIVDPKLAEALEGRKFDVIVGDLPFYPWPEEVSVKGWGKRERLRYTGGPDGRQVLDQAIHQISGLLEPAGEAYLIHPDFLNLGKTKLLLRNLGLQTEIIRRVRYVIPDAEEPRHPLAQLREHIERTNGVGLHRHGPEWAFQVYVLKLSRLSAENNIPAVGSRRPIETNSQPPLSQETADELRALWSDLERLEFSTLNGGFPNQKTEGKIAKLRRKIRQLTNGEKERPFPLGSRSESRKNFRSEVRRGGTETSDSGQVTFLRLEPEEVEALRDPEKEETRQIFVALVELAGRGERVTLAVSTPAEARSLNRWIDEFFLKMDTSLDRSARSRIQARHDVDHRNYQAVFNAGKIWNRVNVITDREEAGLLASRLQFQQATNIQLIVSVGTVPKGDSPLGGQVIARRAEEIRSSLRQKAGLLLISAASASDFGGIYRTSGKSNIWIPTEEGLLVARQMLEAIALESFRQAA